MFCKKLLTTPFVAALVTLVVRLLIYGFEGKIYLPYKFGITTPNSDADTWKEAVFWRERFGVVPDYLLAVVPWYIQYVPAASSAVYAIFLCFVDALTAFLISQWPSSTPKLIFTLFVLNPVMVFLPALESLAPLEHFMLAIIVECCRRRINRGWYIYIAILSACVLGIYFFAVTLALCFPLKMSGVKYDVFWAIFGVLALGGFALFYLFYYGSLTTRTSLYSPPDSGVMWYVRLLIIPAFSRCMDVFQLQLPAILLFPVAVVLPESVSTTTSGYASSIPGDRRLLLVLLAICFSKFCRCNLALSDCSITVLFIYSLLDKNGLQKMNDEKSEDAKLSMFDRIVSSNVFVPLYTTLLLVPLTYSFYTGWVVWDTANPNWLFFPQAAFLIVGGIFLVSFFKVVVDVILAERTSENKLKVE